MSLIQEREIAGCRCIVYSKNGSDHSKAIVYYVALVEMR